MLVSHGGVAGFGAGINAIEQFRFPVEVIARALEMFVPVGEFDDEFDPGVHGSGRFDDEIFRGLIHQAEPELRPTVRALGGDVRIVLGGDKEEIVLNDFVEMPGGEFRRALDELAVGGVGVTKRAELAGTAGRQRHAAGDPHAAVEEEFFDLLDQFRAGEIPVALDLDINLVHLQLAVDAVPVVGEVFRVFKALDDTDGNVNGDVEIGVIAGGTTHGREQNAADENRGGRSQGTKWVPHVMGTFPERLR